MPVEGTAPVDLSSLSVNGVGATGAFIAGLASSAHCALMCGPLAGATGVPPATAASPASAPLVTIRRARRMRLAPLAYHLGRIGSYAVMGAALGTAGEQARRAVAGVGPALPWVMASALVATSLGAGRHLPVPQVLRKLAHPIIRRTANHAPALRAAAIGAATPLLPCAMLYGLFVAAAAAASGLGGAGVMAGFALGATPALALVQAHAPALARFPRMNPVARRLLPLAAAIVLVWRAVAGGAGGAPPACH
jgi:sulfite exporter TauE/SafE